MDDLDLICARLYRLCLKLGSTTVVASDNAEFLLDEIERFHEDQIRQMMEYAAELRKCGREV